MPSPIQENNISSRQLRGDSRFHPVEVQTNFRSEIVAQLEEEVVGQTHAANVVAEAIVRNQSRLSDPQRPPGVFMFVGQTGVGKTEMTKATAQVLHPEEDGGKYFLRIDCTELQQQHSNRRLIGADPTYVGYGDRTLISAEFLSQPGKKVIVFDEIEKAHPSVWQTLMPVIEDAQLKVFAPTGKQSRSAHDKEEVAPLILQFNETYIFFTSNAGAAELQAARKGKRLGFELPSGARGHDLEAIARSGLKEKFRQMPEFLARIGTGNTVVFSELRPEHYEAIFDKFLTKLNQRAGTNLHVTAELRAWMIQQAIGSGEYGARDMRETIEKVLFTKAADLIVSEAVLREAMLVGDVEDGRVVFFASHASEKPVKDIIVYEEPPEISAPQEAEITQVAAEREEKEIFSNVRPQNRIKNRNGEQKEIVWNKKNKKRRAARRRRRNRRFHNRNPH